MTKEKIRQRIAEQTEAFLSAGGVIEQIPRVIFCPKSMQWARDRGMDYVPWEKMGGEGFGYYVNDVEATGEGCYITRAKGFEGSEKV